MCNQDTDSPSVWRTHTQITHDGGEVGRLVHVNILSLADIKQGRVSHFRTIIHQLLNGAIQQTLYEPKQYESSRGGKNVQKYCK